MKQMPALLRRVALGMPCSNARLLTCSFFMPPRGNMTSTQDSAMSQQLPAAKTASFHYQQHSVQNSNSSHLASMEAQ